jgi:hypothetical protein
MLSHMKAFATLAVLLSASNVVSGQTPSAAANLPIETYACPGTLSPQVCDAAGDRITTLQLRGCNIPGNES